VRRIFGTPSAEAAEKQRWQDTCPDQPANIKSNSSFDGRERQTEKEINQVGVLPARKAEKETKKICIGLEWCPGKDLNLEPID
jgi:hypothetical protein